MDTLTVSLIVLLVMVGCWSRAAQEPGPLYVWHFDEPDGEDLLDAGPDRRDLKLQGARRVQGLFEGGIETGEGGYVRGPGFSSVVTGSVEC